MSRGSPARRVARGERPDTDETVPVKVLERHLATRPPITVPTIVLHGADDTVGLPYRSEAQMALFAPATARHVVPGAGHFMPREKPQAVAEALRTLLASTS